MITFTLQCRSMEKDINPWMNIVDCRFMIIHPFYRF